MSYAIYPGPGVPNLLGGLTPLPALQQVTADAISLVGSALGLGPSWGFFLNGSALIPSDNVLSMDARAESVVADYPIERGSFESYDKVKRPADVRFRYSTGGNISGRQAMIQAAKSAKESMQICMAVAPDDTFESVTVNHWDYHRTAQAGVGLVSIDVWGWEVQVNLSSGLSSASAASPSSADPNVASVTPTEAQTTSQGDIMGAWQQGNPYVSVPGFQTTTPFGIQSSSGITPAG